VIIYLQTVMTTAPTKVLDFSPFEISSKPFPYAVARRAFSDEFSLEVLEWLDDKAPWKLAETDFYEQYEFSLVDADIPVRLAMLCDQVFLDALRTEVQNLFGVSLTSRVDATAHKLIPEQRIRIHNDYILGGETHRLLIQLNPGWRDEDGGFLLFFNSSDPSDVHRIFRPAHNSVVAFAITPNSHHAVTTIHGRERFTLVYSFYSER
jgi:Rps23 Pro-64 3,4-dihydroxylase Tpa1-like proline 4-hydroxylase